MAEDSSGTETITFREAIRQALAEEMRRDRDVVLLGEDIAEFGGVFNTTEDLFEEFGCERVRDTPISEAAIVGSGVGGAAVGLRPVVEVTFSDFLGVACEQILNQAAKMRYMFGDQVDIPLTIRTTEGGGNSQGSQHSTTLHTWFAHLPGVKVVAPATPRAAKGLLKTAIQSNDPVLFFEKRVMYSNEGPVPTDDEFTIPLGNAHIERAGDDVTVVATQRLLGETKAAANALEGQVSIEIIDPQSLYPLDTETIIESVKKTGRLVVADESPLSYGLHTEIITRTQESAFFRLDAPMQRVGVPDTHIPFNGPQEDEVLPTADDVRDAITAIV